jgi:diguanylate cyclase (GGDEF)-like protein
METTEGVIKATISAGVCSYAGSEKIHVDSIIKKADDALYEAKESGRNCVKEVV